MRITIIDRGGAVHDCAAQPGRRVLDVALDHGLPILAECGGSCVCGTCHVYVAPEWRDRLSAAADSERELLELLSDARPGSRLCCQIRLTPNLDGLAVTLAPESGF